MSWRPDRERLFSAKCAAKPSGTMRVPERGDVMPHPSFSAKLPPAKPKNADRRTREYLMPTEVERLIGAARQVGRHGHRDATLILLMYRHVSAWPKSVAC